MKVVKLEVIPLQSMVATPYMDSRELITYRQSLLVRITTDEGIEGIGEAAVWGGPHASTMGVLRHELAPLVIGQDPLMIEAIWTRMYQESIMHGRRGLLIAAMGGIDIALWDILGKVAGLPLYKLFGGYSDDVRAYASTGFYSQGQTPATLAETVGALRSSGFTAFKMKVARQAPNPTIRGADLCVTTLEEDYERVRSVRAAIGPDARLMIDANSGWTPKTALRAAKQLEDCDLFFIEEPVQTDDIEGSIFLREHSPVPIAGYETETSRFGVKELIARKAVDIVQFDSCWTGGISEVRKIAGMAAAHNMQCVPHSLSTAVAMTANMHVVGSLSNADMIEWDVNDNPLVDDLLETPFELRADGRLGIPDGPGLGIELDWDVVERYRHPEAS